MSVELFLTFKSIVRIFIHCRQLFIYLCQLHTNIFNNYMAARTR